MPTIVVSDRVALGRVAADRIGDAVSRRPQAVIGVATGSSPLPVYRELAQRVGRRELDLSGATFFALDEYVGLPPGHPQRYREVLRRELVGPLGLDPAQIRVPDVDGGTEEELAAAADAYEAELKALGGAEVQLLGIGGNGHLGFNEPPAALRGRTRHQPLAEQTRRDNARFFDAPDDVPRSCITQGLGTILDARELVLVATGAGKAQIVAAALEGPVTASVPGSVVQLHPRVTVVLDQEAASGLRLPVEPG